HLVRGQRLRGRCEHAAAEAAFMRVLALDGIDSVIVSRAMVGLGGAALEADNSKTAQDWFEKAITHDPVSPRAHQGRGDALIRLGADMEALTCYQQALKLDGRNAALFNDMGGILLRMQKLPEAARAYEIAIRIRPDFTLSYNNLGSTLYQLGRFEDAARIFAACMARSPDNAYARHMLAALKGVETPSRASDDFVRVAFDNFADAFEDKLTRLEYSVPRIVQEKLNDLLGSGRGDLSVLDAGCGTGWCASWLRPYAKHLVGVDLSSRMLVKAQKTGFYDDLAAAELTGWLTDHPCRFDIILAADVFCYFGELDAVMIAAARALTGHGALLAFSVESMEAEEQGDHVLRKSGRYAHAPDCIDRLLRQAGLEILSIARVPIRLEGGSPIMGDVVISRSS
ncbi:MAG: tetratricopeptide repeat protein, partial [Pseudomonadota bacterium]|nr:tetratricopeptide repeat protein [Pseudomonadota bacterium]